MATGSTLPGNKRRCILVKKTVVVFVILLFLAGFIAFVCILASAQDVPRRVETTVEAITGDNDHSRVTFFIREDNFNVQRLVVTKLPDGGFQYSWTNTDEAGNPMVMVRQTGGPYDGYWRYTITQARNYQNYIYRFGRNGSWMEVRAFPPNENAHANYQKNTDTCKNCHSTHYALTSRLLNQKLVLELCLSCHDGSGSKYNVLDGEVIVPGGAVVSSPAGPFGSAVATSYHNVFREDTGTVLLAPGGTKTGLSCTDCHSAHVLQDQTKPVRASGFRLLKHYLYETPAGAMYDQPPVVAYSHVTGSSYETVYVSGMNEFCSHCHEHYNYGANPNPRLPSYPTHTLRTEGGDGILKSGQYYRHPTGINIAGWLKVPVRLPLEERGTGGRYMTCKTCHYAHGTAIISGYHYSDRFEVDKYAADGRPLDRSTMLKRTEGMGICLECHLDIWHNTGYRQ